MSLTRRFSRFPGWGGAILAAMCLHGAAIAQDGSKDAIFDSAGVFNGTAAQNVQMPVYERGRLKLIVYGGSVAYAEKGVDFKKLLVDLIDDAVKDVNNVVVFDDKALYPLSSTRERVDDFWRKYDHAKVFFETSAAVYDPVTRFFSGEKAVRVRSKLMDGDGVGFESVVTGNTVERVVIKSDVNVVLRTGNDGEQASGQVGGSLFN